jgi:hypothetical protein
MRRKLLWGLLALALAAPAAWATGKLVAQSHCPLPFCDECPLRK